MLKFSEFLIEGPKTRKVLKATGKVLKVTGRVATAPVRYAKNNHGTEISKWNEKNFGIFGKILNRAIGLNAKKKKPTRKTTRKKKP